MSDRQELIEKILSTLRGNARYCKIDNDLYLTDSRLLFRIKNAANGFQPGTLPDINPNSINGVWRHAVESPEFVLIEKVCAVSAKPNACQKCNGTGIVHLCSTCSGEGEIYCRHCENTNDCPVCMGSGIGKTGEKHPCDRCTGSGVESTPVSCLGAHIDLKYLRVIAEVAPISFLFCQRPIPDSKAFSVFYFKNDHIDGLVMGMCL